MLNMLEQLIIGAIVYFDIFEYPLTLLELHRFLLCQNSGEVNREYSLNEVRQALSGSSDRPRPVTTDGWQDKIVCQYGFYCLAGRGEIIQTRKRRYIFAKHKYDRTRWVSKILSRWPFIRMIAVCNSLAYDNAREESDIDLFVITSARGVWWARFFSLLILQILRLRPGQGGIKDKICLSFFIDEDNLNLRDLQVGRGDYYLPYWLSTLYPLYDAGGFYVQFLLANNWVLNFLPQARPITSHRIRAIPDKSSVKYLLEALLAPFTSIVKFIQTRAFPPEIYKLINRDSRVRVGDGILKFHTNDRREQYMEEFERRYNRLLI